VLALVLAPAPAQLLALTSLPLPPNSAWT
jgi:hypothetical protein